MSGEKQDRAKIAVEVLWCGDGVQALRCLVGYESTVGGHLSVTVLSHFLR